MYKYTLSWPNKSIFVFFHFLWLSVNFFPHAWTCEVLAFSREHICIPWTCEGERVVFKALVVIQGLKYLRFSQPNPKARQHKQPACYLSNGNSKSVVRREMADNQQTSHSSWCWASITKLSWEVQAGRQCRPRRAAEMAASVATNPILPPGSDIGLYSSVPAK